MFTSELAASALAGNRLAVGCVDEACSLDVAGRRSIPLANRVARASQLRGLGEHSADQ